MTETTLLSNLISWDVHVFDILIGAGLAFSIPFIYSRIQRGLKKLRLTKFWDIFREELGNIKKKVAVSRPTSELQCVVDKIKRIELLVSDILNEKQFHEYLDRIDLFEELVSNATVDVIHPINEIDNYLKDLISTNKPPRYLVWATSKLWSR